MDATPVVADFVPGWFVPSPNPIGFGRDRTNSDATFVPVQTGTNRDRTKFNSCMHNTITPCMHDIGRAQPCMHASKSTFDQDKRQDKVFKG